MNCAHYNSEFLEDILNFMYMQFYKLIYTLALETCLRYGGFLPFFFHFWYIQFPFLANKTNSYFATFSFLDNNP